MSHENKLNQLQQINRICNHFEDQILAGRNPEIEPFLRKIEDTCRNDLLSELIRIELFYLKEQGHTPNIADYDHRFPGDPASVSQAFKDTREAEQSVSVQASLAQEPVALTTGHLIDHFRIEQLLGSGAFADVYLAYDRNNNRPVALKIMKPQQANDGQPNQRAIQCFIDEAELLSRLDNQHIAQIYDVGKNENGLPYVAMEYVKGDSLQFLLREDLIDGPTAVKLIAETAEVLADIHRENIFHRDLKPANVIVGLDGKPRIVDFGLALAESEQVQRRGEVAGTINYMSPEQLKGQSHRLDGRTDIWSLGIMLYEILAQRLPFRGANREQLIDEILKRDPRPLRQFDNRISTGLESVCLKALEKNSRNRYLTAMDFCRAIRNELGEFAEGLADVSKGRSDSAKGRAELRLATQTRFWNEKPEKQRLPTFRQYSSILIHTDAMTRTVAESRMMTSAFGYFAKRAFIGLLIISSVMVATHWFLTNNRLNITNRDKELESLVRAIGTAETKTELSLLTERLEDETKALPKIVDQLENAFALNQHRDADNYLKTVFDNGRFQNSLISSDNSDRLNLLWQTEKPRPLDESTRQAIHNRVGIAEDYFVLCPNMDPEFFDAICLPLAVKNYMLIDFDITKDRTRAAAIWSRGTNVRIDNPYKNVTSFNAALHVFDAMQKPKFDLTKVLSADFFSGGTNGIEGLVDFDIEFAATNDVVETREQRFGRELEFAKQYSGPQTFSSHFVKARANFHLGQFDSCRHEMDWIEDEFAGIWDSRLLGEFRLGLAGRRGDRRRLNQLLQRFEPTSLAALQSKWLLNQDSNVFDEAGRLSAHSQAKLHSFIAEEMAKTGRANESQQHLESAATILDAYFDSKPKDKLNYAHSMFYHPDLDYLKRYKDLSELSGIGHVLVTSGSWNYNSEASTLYTGGKRPFASLAQDHLAKAANYTKDGYRPTKIRLAKHPTGEIYVSSIWKRNKNRSARDNRIANQALAIVGQIKHQLAIGAKLRPQDFESLKDSPDQTLRTEVLATIARQGVDCLTGALQPIQELELEPSVVQALISSVSLYDAAELSKHRRTIEKLNKTIDLTDPGVHSCMQLLLQKAGIEVPVHAANEPIEQPKTQWYYNILGQKMVRCGDVWFSSTEVTVDQYDKVLGRKNNHHNREAKRNASFYNAARFCNELNKRSGTTQDQWSFVPNENGKYGPGIQAKPNFEKLSGYRLPTNAEWESAYSQNTTTRWFHGRDESNLPLFANILGSDNELTVAIRLPNRKGLFDMGGNVAEWLMPTENQVTTIDENSKLSLFGGHYKLTGSAAMARLLESTPRSTNFINATGIRVVRKFRPAVEPK